MADFIAENSSWMYWTIPSGIAFGALFLVLAAMAVWDMRSPSVPRKGFLPIETTRGDRLFIAIMTMVGLHLVWLGVIGVGAVWVVTAASAASAVLIGRRG